MTSRILLAGVSALALTASAVAANAAPVVVLNGGGGTLAAKVYRDIFNCYAEYSATVPSKNAGIYASTVSPGNPSNVTYPTGPNAVCVQGKHTTAVGYEPVGSGAGLSAYTTATPANFGSPSSTNTIAYLNSTYANLTSTPYPQIQFAGSDAYLGGTQTANQASAQDGDTSGGDSFAFQLPALATSITLPITGSATHNLTTTDICNIFSGQVQTTSAGVTLSEVVVRSDGSGTSFIFSDFLAKNCPAGDNFNTANGFPSTKPNWSAVFADFPHTGQLPLVAVSGSGGIAGEVAAPVNGGQAVGYVSPDYVPPHATVNETASTVGGLSPIVTQANVGKTTGSNLDEVAIRLKKVVVPTSYDSATVGSALNDTLVAPGGAGYPIVGFTFIDTYKCYAPSIKSVLGTKAQGTALKAVLTTLYPASLTANTAQILANQGFEPVLKSSKTAKLLFNTTNGPLGKNGIEASSCPAS